MNRVTTLLRHDVPVTVARLSTGVVELRTGEPDGDFVYSQMTPATARWLAGALLEAAGEAGKEEGEKGDAE